MNNFMFCIEKHISILYCGSVNKFTYFAVQFCTQLSRVFMAVPRYLRFWDDLLPFEGSAPKLSSSGDAGELRPEESLPQGNDSILKVDGNISRLPVTCLILEWENESAHNNSHDQTLTHKTMEPFITIMQW